MKETKWVALHKLLPPPDDAVPEELQSTVTLEYDGVLVKKLKVVRAEDLDVVLSAYQTTADALNMIGLSPSTISDVKKRMELLFPDLDAEQQELELDEIN